MTTLPNSSNWAVVKEWVSFTQPVLHILLIVVLAWILIRVVRKLLRVFRTYMAARTHDPEEVKRVETLGRAFRYTASVVITLVAGMLILSVLGISIAPILATAGVVGIAVGFGAQSLIKDYFNGFFILVENQIRQGDVIEAAGKSGVVEEITLRHVRLRDYEGSVHYVPNGAITTVTNKSRGFVFAVIEIGVGYNSNIDQVFAVMKSVGAQLRKDPRLSAQILDDLEISGIEKLGDSAVIVRARIKSIPSEKNDVRREYLKRLKQSFDENKIELPYPQLTLHVEQDKPQIRSQ